jgi:hypothetical protein
LGRTAQLNTRNRATEGFARCGLNPYDLEPPIEWAVAGLTPGREYQFKVHAFVHHTNTSSFSPVPVSGCWPQPIGGIVCFSSPYFDFAESQKFLCRSKGFDGHTSSIFGQS